MPTLHITPIAVLSIAAGAIAIVIVYRGQAYMVRKRGGRAIARQLLVAANIAIFLALAFSALALSIPAFVLGVLLFATFNLWQGPLLFLTGGPDPRSKVIDGDAPRAASRDIPGR